MFELRFHPAVKRDLNKIGKSVARERSGINTLEISRKTHQYQKIFRICSKA